MEEITTSIEQYCYNEDLDNTDKTDQERIMYAIYNEEDYKEVKAGTKEIEWKQYTPTVTWVLKEPQGINIIYAVFKDRAGNISMSQGILETP